MTQYAVWDSSDSKILLGPTNLPSWWVDSNKVRHENLFSMTETHLNTIGWYRVENNFIGLSGDNLEYKILTPGIATLENNVIKLNQNLSWKPIDEIKKIKSNIIDSYREEKINNGVMFGGVNFDSNERTVSNWTAVATAINTYNRKGLSFPEPILWIGADDTVFELTVDEFDNLTLSAINYVSTCWHLGRTHKNNILAMTDAASMVAYDHTVGWPSNDLGGSISSLP